MYGFCRRFVFFVLLAIIFAFGVDWYRFLHAPSINSQRIFRIGQGQGLRSVASKLEKKEIIRSAVRFQILAYLTGKERQIQAGAFLIPAGSLPLEVLDLLTNGRPVRHILTIPEGLSWWQTGELLEKSGYCSLSDFADAVYNRRLLARYGIRAENAEGFLFPSTYFFAAEEKENASKIVARLLRTFWEQSGFKKEEDWKRIYRLVTLASLVEKETSIAEERAKIAGVFDNRLRIKMRLQCDPTVIYGLGASFNGNLTKKNLQDSQNLFNTYKHAGLPPGPICSVGKAALTAARFPEKHKFLYFVAKGNGQHVFSSTLKEHNQAVRQYLKTLQK